MTGFTKCRAPGVRSAMAIAWVIALLGCEPEKPPAPQTTPASSKDDASESAATATYVPGKTEAVLTYAGERGAFADTSKIEDVPDDAKGLVRVALLGGEAPPSGTVWVANFKQPADDGSFALTTVPRDLFEEYALGQGRSSKVELPEGLEPPEQVAAVEGKIVVYKTSWCGVCKKLEAYLKRKGVEYEAKDIEKDSKAAAELQAKAKAKGMSTGSVPVIDIGGELMVGFDRAKLEKMLG
jgi:glutaredoxin-like YruB-family protein